MYENVCVNKTLGGLCSAINQNEMLCEFASNFMVTIASRDNCLNVFIDRQILCEFCEKKIVFDLAVWCLYK